MKINGDNNNGPIRPDRARGPHTLPIDRGERVRKTPSEIEKLDRVEISDAGRARANAKLEPTTRGESDRLDAVRQRVLRGAYDSNEVVGEVARRILDRGDV